MEIWNNFYKSILGYLQIILEGNVVNNKEGTRETTGQKEKLNSCSVNIRDPPGGFEPGKLPSASQNEIRGWALTSAQNVTNMGYQGGVHACVQQLFWEEDNF